MLDPVTEEKNAPKPTMPHPPAPRVSADPGSTQPDNMPVQLEQQLSWYLRDLGNTIRQERIVRGLTAEQAAHFAKVAYKTWLRIESGHPVRDMTWSGVDRLFDLAPGTALRVRNDYGDLAAVLADHRGDRLGETTSQIPPSEQAALHRKMDENADSVRQSIIRLLPRISLADRISGLGLEDLRRLRDMVDAVIVSKEHPDLAEQIATASKDLAQTGAYLKAILEKKLELHEQFRKNDWMGSEPDELQKTIDQLTPQQEHAQSLYNDALKKYDYLDSKVKVFERSIPMEFLNSSVDQGGESGEHGKTPER